MLWFWQRRLSIRKAALLGFVVIFDFRVWSFNDKCHMMRITECVDWPQSRDLSKFLSKTSFAKMDGCQVNQQLTDSEEDLHCIMLPKFWHKASPQCFKSRNNIVWAQCKRKHSWMRMIYATMVISCSLWVHKLMFIEMHQIVNKVLLSFFLQKK